MRLLFVTDARSPISRNWMRFFFNRGDEVFIASTFEWEEDLPAKGIEFTPVAFSSAKKRSSAPSSASSRTLGLRTQIRQWLGPLTIAPAAQKLRSFVQAVQPDVVHALRIPYEGMLTAAALEGLSNRPAFIASVWGNDFTLHAPATRLMGYYTRKVLHEVDGLHADVERDVRLAKKHWGLSVEKPSLVVPGNGGIRGDVFYPPKDWGQGAVVINPRGVRPYVRNDVFFRAIPLVLEKQPEARFLCTGMQNEPQIQSWVKALGITHAVELLPALPHEKMAEVFRGAQVVVSPSIHDGTPNSLIEAMACGCFPVVGDLESLREWITHGQNGLLFNATEPQSIADAILLGLERADLRREAAGLNEKLISARAEYGACMKQVLGFYELVCKQT